LGHALTVAHLIACVGFTVLRRTADATRSLAEHTIAERAKKT
jgi:hypothetical protein